MVKRKSNRTRGKLPFSRYFQEFKEGDFVSVIKEPSVNVNLPDRYQGRTGVILTKRGRAYVVLIKDKNKEKKFIIEPIHLKKIKAPKLK